MFTFYPYSYSQKIREIKSSIDYTFRAICSNESNNNYLDIKLREHISFMEELPQNKKRRVLKNKVYRFKYNLLAYALDYIDEFNLNKERIDSGEYECSLIRFEKIINKIKTLQLSKNKKNIVILKQRDEFITKIDSGKVNQELYCIEKNKESIKAREYNDFLNLEKEKAKIKAKISEINTDLKKYTIENKEDIKDSNNSLSKVIKERSLLSINELKSLSNKEVFFYNKKPKKLFVKVNCPFKFKDILDQLPINDLYDRYILFLYLKEWNKKNLNLSQEEFKNLTENTIVNFQDCKYIHVPNFESIKIKNYDNLVNNHGELKVSTLESSFINGDLKFLKIERETN